ncbi:UvrD-like helicase, ATP-binding domain, P-loop containing nucleoside triphosphate hydrolase [Tanacetum coccineum]
MPLGHMIEQNVRSESMKTEASISSYPRSRKSLDRKILIRITSKKSTSDQRCLSRSGTNIYRAKKEKEEAVLTPNLPDITFIMLKDTSEEIGTTFAARRSKRVATERTLTDAQRDEFEDMLCALTLERIRKLMGFCEIVLYVLEDEGEYFSNHIASLEEKVENDAIQKAEESSESENNSDESSDDETSKLKLLQKVVLTPNLPDITFVMLEDMSEEIGTTFAARRSKHVATERTLTDAQRDEFEDMLCALTLERIRGEVEYDAIHKAGDSSESEDNSDESSDDETSKLKLLQRIWNCLAQLYAKDITPDDKHELDEVLQRELYWRKWLIESKDTVVGRVSAEALIGLNASLHQFLSKLSVLSKSDSGCTKRDIYNYEKRYLPGLMFGTYSFINVVGGREEKEDDDRSWRNLVEVAVVMKILHNVYKAWNVFKEKLTIGVVSPYFAQVVSIQEKLAHKYEKLDGFSVKVKSIDGCHGGEEDIIIFIYEEI